jgi:hypothetical protein
MELRIRWDVPVSMHRLVLCLLFACSSPKTAPPSSEPTASTTIDAVPIDVMQIDAMQLDATPVDAAPARPRCAGYRAKAAEACAKRGCTYGPHTPCTGVQMPYQDPKPCGCVCGREIPCARP